MPAHSITAFGAGAGVGSGAGPGMGPAIVRAGPARTNAENMRVRKVTVAPLSRAGRWSMGRGARTMHPPSMARTGGIGIDGRKATDLTHVYDGVRCGRQRRSVSARGRVGSIGQRVDPR